MDHFFRNHLLKSCLLLSLTIVLVSCHSGNDDFSSYIAELLVRSLFFLPVYLFGRWYWSLNFSETEVEIIIKNNKFEPAEIVAPTDTKIKLKVVNTDPTPREFESYKLHCEKIIPGNSTQMIYVGTLDAGEYDFYGEFHEKPTRGKLIVK